jgi:alcohol dehydrogenase
MNSTFDFQPRTRTIFGTGVIKQLGDLGKELGFKRTLLVADRGLVDSGHVAEAVAPLRAAGIDVIEFTTLT